MGKGWKNILYMGLSLGMIAFAVPRIDLGDWANPSTIFGVVWIAFALLIVAAHLHELLGVEEEKKRQLLRIKRMKRWQLQQAVTGKRRVLQVRR
ncbi:hypothetical protein SAMN02799630_02626 [Paenibacillus sp. UNCCL117]|uniref:hypothetical protein n=1 Tax=unclassified Paenibacillus TaxID=185978 RepID=UPI0008811F23|nr:MULTISPECIES: hypothetical protein [unclassified Paenibacillus]SDC08398.1 hypothetical protein SAMN04488602_101295 [Paenibacillus sp. cl123]SFW38242.1 hypothetical protein SAMN02799630_02626 [Paenibacillus sp. UNCCL117]